MRKLVVIILMIGFYVGAYGSLMEQKTPSEFQPGISLFHKVPNYRWDSAIVHEAFAPVHAVDRRMRFRHWETQTEYSALNCTDDVEYFEPGPEFKLANEAAAMKAAQAEQAKIIEEEAKLQQK